jgi:hypothetical protein
METPKRAKIVIGDGPSGDKRSVSTDALETLGSIIGYGEKRDAIHLAVEPVIAAHVLRPGEDVGFIPGEGVGVCENPVGIVDPFLKAAVQKGQRFWLVVYPRKITSLRHVWEHPEFPLSEGSPVAEKRISKSESWLRSYADQISVDYQELIVRTKIYLESGDYWSEGGRFEGERIPDEFWEHYENVTGKTVAADDRESFFSCSC